MRRRTMAASVAVLTLTVGGVVAATSGATRALFSDTAKGADSRVGAATVALGRGGGTVELGYTELRPGRRQIVELTISYEGSVPADVTLEIAPSGTSQSQPELCVRPQGKWQSRPGGAVTVAIGSAAPVSYCELLNGRTLPLASAVRPGSEIKIDVAVLLSEDANGNLRGRAQRDVATVRASGGFTDHAVGTISITTAGPDQPQRGDRPQDGKRAWEDPTARKPDPQSPVDPGRVNPGSLPQSLPSRALPARPAVMLPAECEQAGMRLDGFEDVIVLSAGQHTWKALDQRGQGAGPFLVVGTDGDDEIVGSAGGDCIVGGGGRDQLAGGAGNDVLIGGADADQLDGGLADDGLFGGPGFDDLRGGEGVDRLDGGPDGASCDAGPHADGATHCQGPTAAPSPTTANGEKARSDGGSTSPTTARPPAPASPSAVADPPAATTVAPASAGSASPATHTDHAEPPSDGTAQAAPHGAGEDPSAATTTASAPPLGSSADS